ncbi:pyrBI [Symbiodinium natans]|uniref:PyrBI protein n=1 Tax=Symbiodinium natans TaxID=878477 RepID=A0A812LRS5_9DINO|nr:pyrBI [Symbiodinium natans]
MAGPVAAGLEPVLSKILSDGQATSPPLETLAATVLNECSTLAEVSVGSYRRKGASQKTAAANPPAQLRWGYASITKTVVGVVMQMLMANSSLPEIGWRLGAKARLRGLLVTALQCLCAVARVCHMRNDKLSQWLPDLAPGTDFENASLLDVASHSACLFPDGAPWTAEGTAALWSAWSRGIVAYREVWVNNTLQYGALGNCTPELNTVHNYVHVDGVQVLALIEERISGMDFGTLAKTLIFDPLHMSTAEVVDANPAGGLWAPLSELGIYGQWLVQGYNGRPEALAKTLLKQQDFVDLLSPIQKHGVLLGTGRTFAVWSDWKTGEPRAGHGGCLGAYLELQPTQNLVHIVAFFPEDADWVVSCDTMVPQTGNLWAAQASIREAFEACRQRPAHLCGSSPVATSLSCEITETFTLDENTLDAPYKKSSCKEEDLTSFVKGLLDTYRAVDFSTKAFVVTEGCWGTFQYYASDPCTSIHEGFKLCQEQNWDCGVFLVNNDSYIAEDLPCRCGVSVPKAVCSTFGEMSCNITRSSPEINTSCLIRSDTGPATSTSLSGGTDTSTSVSGGTGTSTSVSGGADGSSTSLSGGLSSASGECRICGSWLCLPLGLVGLLL